MHTHEWNSYTLFLTKHCMNTGPTYFLSLFCCLLCQKSLPFFSSLPSLYFFPEILLLLSQEEPLRQPRSAFSPFWIRSTQFSFFFFYFFLTWLQFQGQFEILEEFWWFFIFNLFLVLILRFLEGSEKHANICGPP